MTVTANQYDPAGELSLPERIVHAVESAIQGAATDVHEYRHGDWVGGYVADLARSGAAALLDVMAEDLKSQLCDAGEGACLCCWTARSRVRQWRSLAQAVVDVPAVEAV